MLSAHEDAIIGMQYYWKNWQETQQLLFLKLSVEGYNVYIAFAACESLFPHFWSNRKKDYIVPNVKVQYFLLEVRKWWKYIMIISYINVFINKLNIYMQWSHI